MSKELSAKEILKRQKHQHDFTMYQLGFVKYLEDTVDYGNKTFKNFSVEKDPANNCLDVAIITDPKLRSKKTIKKLKNIAGRVLNKKN